MVIKTIIW